MTPKDDKFLATRSDLIAQITGYMGGRVEEELKFGDITTGASNDIQEATKIARSMVMHYGMSELGCIQYDQNNGSVFLGRDYTSGGHSFGNETAVAIDNAVRKIIDECYEDAKKILTEHADLVELIATTLMEKEVLTAEEIESLDKTGKLPEPKPAPVVEEKSEVTANEPSELESEISKEETSEEEQVETK